MQRNQQIASPTPLHLRRNQTRRQEEYSQQSSSYGGNGPIRFRETPDLSVHIPRSQSSNRFGVLALPTPPPETEEIKELHIPSRYRRSRNSRGTKEAKRRRDARRSRRKMAAQMLDEQLSRDIDFVLSKVNGFPTPPSSRPSPVSTLSRIPRTHVWPTNLPPLPPSPPQLPLVDFNSFGINVNSFLEDRAARASRASSFSPAPCTPLAPPTALIPDIPSWCPPLPCLTRRGVWSEGLPIFYDLSSMPEPLKPTMHLREPKPCQELQLWRGNLTIKPKQSRFFPRTPVVEKPRVKLTPTACKLHVTEKSLPTQPLIVSSTYADAVKKGTDADVAKHGADVTVIADVETSTPEFQPSAANLWNILAETTGQTSQYPYPYLASFQPKTEDSCMAAWQAHIETAEQDQTPAELDSREIPYVHANSLTGHSNELRLSPYAIEHPEMSDSAVCFTPLASPPLGLNDMMMDYDIGLPYAIAYAASYNDEEPQRPASVQRSLILADILPINCIEDNDDGEEIMATSDAQFRSEQSLFTLGTAPKSAVTEEIDIATFLKMGHAKNCWCGFCSDEPEVEGSTTSDNDSKGTDTPELVPFDRLTEMDDDWMLYSPTTDEESVSSKASHATVSRPTTRSEKLERQPNRASYVMRPTWDEIFPCKPHVICQVKEMQGEEEVVESASSEESEWVWTSEF
ncbi:hypothetical protein LTR56_013713 [Elasticomyces elasticus]|nr:hypothetical protein LTR56_013713 [Elasticomyces elasticus]KAK3668465.1 hypothetical protein LTR22_000758 [Elasticomyces elasticus]KAK4930846.1 hypothetical protein LTR49_002611 [Elasticomyces elasticus]KAK5753703.1 hypothetical protein LTS12_016228 [Elasticomyces elasticus]